MLMQTLISNSGMLNFNNEIDVVTLLVKFMFIIGGFIYLLFAFLVTRQIDLMSKTVATTASPINKLLGYIHLLLSLLILIYFLLVL